MKYIALFVAFIVLMMGITVVTEAAIYGVRVLGVAITGSIVIAAGIYVFVITRRAYKWVMSANSDRYAVRK